VTELAAGINELKINDFQSVSVSLRKKGLSEDEWSLLWSDAATLDEEEIVLDDTVVWETSQRSDGLFSQIGSSAGVVLSTFVSDTSTNSVYLLVDFSSVVVTVLTGSGNSPHNLSRMPSTDTSDSSETSVGLSWQSSDTESVSNTFVSATLGDTNDVDHFVITEDGSDSDFLFEVLVGEVDLLGDGASVDLDFEEVGLLLSQGQKVVLGVDKDSDNSAVFLDSVELEGDGFSTVLVFSRVLGESLLLGVNPVLVESSLELVAEMLGPDGGEGSETSWGFNVTNNTDNDDWWGFNDCAGFNNFLLVQFGASSVNGSDDVGHTGLETRESGKMDWLLWVVFWEAAHSASMMAGSSSWEETQRTVSWSSEFSVRHVLEIFFGL